MSYTHHSGCTLVWSCLSFPTELSDCTVSELVEEWQRTWRLGTFESLLANFTWLQRWKQELIFPFKNYWSSFVLLLSSPQMIMSHVFKRFHQSHEGKTLCRRLLSPGGHTWNSMYASFALGLRVLTDRLLVFPWTGGCCSTMPEGWIRWNVYFRPICNSFRVQNVLYLSWPVCTYTSQIYIYFITSS